MNGRDAKGIRGSSTFVSCVGDRMGMLGDVGEGVGVVGETAVSHNWLKPPPGGNGGSYSENGDDWETAVCRGYVKAT